MMYTHAAPLYPTWAKDPLYMLLIDEGSFDEADVLESVYESGTHRRATSEVCTEGFFEGADSMTLE